MLDSAIFRSSQYDKLLAAEAKAEKEKKGLFADKVEGFSAFFISPFG